MVEQEMDFAGMNEPLPALFVGHGSPMNAMEENEFSRAWSEVGAALPRPRAILCVSAHWETRGTRVTAMAQPRTIHDFYGFPAELYAQRYPAPGSAALAALIRAELPMAVTLDHAWGLDHGTWSVLKRMFPAADIPVVQLSLDYTATAAQHYAIGRALRPLRRRGVLIVGSGNLVHNLRLVQFAEGAYPWAVEFDEAARRLIVERDHEPLIHYERLGRAANLAIPTNEHYLPLLYALAVTEPEEPIRFFAERVTYYSLSMRSLITG
ncbi:MAG: 4,5-DOPA-extradiol-dioxygenase [Chloroflexota bacterium]